MGKCKAKKQPHLCALTYRSRMSGTNYSKTDAFSSSTPIRSVACWPSYRASRRHGPGRERDVDRGAPGQEKPDVIFFKYGGKQHRHRL
jgi:hypothetical protein